MLYELKGQNKDWMMVHADTPEAAIEHFHAHCPNSEFCVISTARSSLEVMDSVGDRVVILRSKFIQGELHYETSLEKGSWMPASMFSNVLGEVAA